MDTTQKISELGVANSAAVIHPTDTVMLSRTASVGHVVRIGRPMATTQAFMTWTCGQDLEPRYLVLVLNAMKPEFERIAYGSTHKTIYMPDLEQLRVPLPSLTAQRTIADYLDTETARIDALIAKKRGLQAKLDERDLALAYEMVTGHGEPGCRKVAMTWLGSVPAEWPVASVSSQFEVVLGRMLNAERADGPDQRPYVRNVNVRWDVVDMTDTATMAFTAEDRKRLRLAQGDLLVNEGGAGIGRTAVWQGELDECYIQKAVLRLRPISWTAPAWLVECMRLAVHMKVFLVEGNLATIPHVPAESLRSHRFPFPPRGVQHRMLQCLHNARQDHEEMRILLTRQIDLLIEHRQALITAAVTGEQEIPGMAA
jgi:type I restriction enzyme S subunit